MLQQLLDQSSKEKLKQGYKALEREMLWKDGSISLKRVESLVKTFKTKDI